MDSVWSFLCGFVGVLIIVYLDVFRIFGSSKIVVNVLLNNVFSGVYYGEL